MKNLLTFVLSCSLFFGTPLAIANTAIDVTEGEGAVEQVSFTAIAIKPVLLSEAEIQMLQALDNGSVDEIVASATGADFDADFIFMAIVIVVVAAGGIRL